MLSDEESKSSAAVKPTLRAVTQCEKGRISSRLHQGTIVIAHPGHNSPDCLIMSGSDSLTTRGMNKLHEGVITPRSSINLPGDRH